MIDILRHYGTDLFWEYHGDLYIDGELDTEFWYDKIYDAKTSSMIYGNGTKKSDLTTNPFTVKGRVCVLIEGNACLGAIWDLPWTYQSTLMYLDTNLKFYRGSPQIDYIDIYLEDVQLKVMQYRNSIGL